MIDVEPVIIDELQRLAPYESIERDWHDARTRVRSDGRGHSRRRLLVAGAIACLAVVTTPALALSTTLRSLVGLSKQPRHVLVFGMTPKQVEKVAGRPDSKRSGCWYYTPANHMVGAISMGEPGSNAYRTANRVKLCFFFGVLNSEWEHVHNPTAGWKWISVYF
jgi:hypothetical protein